MSIAATADFKPVSPNPLILRLAVAAACIALADWLLIGLPINSWNWPSEGWQIGISLPLFLGPFGIIATACNGVFAARKLQIIMGMVFVAGLLALAEDLDFLSLVVGTLATAMFVIVMTARETSSWQRQLFEAATIPFRGPFRLVGDIFGALRQVKTRTLWLGSLVAWIVPLSVFAVFLALFASANPLIEHQIMRIDLRIFFEFLGSFRTLFWILTGCTIWPLIHRRFKPRPVRQTAALTAEPSGPDFLLGEKATLRSLILFNALFALQTVLDLTYLWGGAKLPDGMTAAEYAHRGAYPLIVTALLAAGFVLVAMRRNGPAAHSRLIRPLVLAWTGQNILLVISAMFRLDLYVAAFSLTELRLAAFIWMALVAMGLSLIVVQIVRKKSNSWLVSANAAVLALVLYGCCFINAPWLIAYYNVEHCREVTGTGPKLDLQYLTSLGVETLPPIEARLKEFPGIFVHSVGLRLTQDQNYFSHSGHWRAWSFRAWRLQRYFANKDWLNQTDSGKG